MADATLLPDEAAGELPPGTSPFGASARRFSRNHLAVASSVVLALVVAACFIGPLLAPFSGEDADFENIAAPIRLLSLHPFGTDDLGRDLLLRVLAGGRVSLALGFFGALVSVLISVVYGATAGYLGGRIDDAMMRAVDILLAIPFMFLVILINVTLGRVKVTRSLGPQGPEIHTIFQSPYCILANRAVSDILSIW